jgi:hypothetical protein
MGWAVKVTLRPVYPHERTAVPIEQEAIWAPVGVWKFCRIIIIIIIIIITFLLFVIDIRRTPIFGYINYSFVGENQGGDNDRNVTSCSLLCTSTFQRNLVSSTLYYRRSSFHRNVGTHLSLYTA